MYVGVGSNSFTALGMAAMALGARCLSLGGGKTLAGCVRKTAFLQPDPPGPSPSLSSTHATLLLCGIRSNPEGTRRGGGEEW